MARPPALNPALHFADALAWLSARRAARVYSLRSGDNSTEFDVLFAVSLQQVRERGAAWMLSEAKRLVGGANRKPRGKSPGGLVPTMTGLAFSLRHICLANLDGHPVARLPGSRSFMSEQQAEQLSETAKHLDRAAAVVGALAPLATDWESDPTFGTSDKTGFFDFAHALVKTCRLLRIVEPTPREMVALAVLRSLEKPLVSISGDRSKIPSAEAARVRDRRERNWAEVLRRVRKAKDLPPIAPRSRS